MKIRTIGAPEYTLYSQDGKHNYFAWPSIARLQDGRLAAVCSGFRKAHVDPFGKAVMATSSDEGETWSLPTPVIDTPLDDRDAGIVPFGENSLLVTSFNNRVAQQRAWNPEDPYIRAYLDTVTPEEEAKYLGATFRISHDGGVTFGPVFRSPVTSPHGPCVMPDGTLLWVGTDFGDGAQAKAGINTVQAWTIAEDGTMTKIGEIENAAPDGRRIVSCEPHALPLPDGSLLCHIRMERAEGDTGPNVFSTWQSRSLDGGRTWSRPEALLGPAGGAPAHLMLHSSGLLISAYGYRTVPYGVRVMVSRDLGHTWEKDLVLYENPYTGDLGYPASVELKDGTILTVFYAHPTADGPAVILRQRWALEE